MSARLTPAAVAKREIVRCQRKQDQLTMELQHVQITMGSWQRVLDAINAANEANGDQQHHDDGVGAE